MKQHPLFTLWYRKFLAHDMSEPHTLRLLHQGQCHVELYGVGCLKVVKQSICIASCENAAGHTSLFVVLVRLTATNYVHVQRITYLPLSSWFYIVVRIKC